jgi:hypothetical protein
MFSLRRLIKKYDETGSLNARMRVDLGGYFASDPLNLTRSQLIVLAFLLAPCYALLS